MYSLSPVLPNPMMQQQNALNPQMSPYAAQQNAFNNPPAFVPPALPTPSFPSAYAAAQPMQNMFPPSQAAYTSTAFNAPPALPNPAFQQSYASYMPVSQPMYSRGIDPAILSARGAVEKFLSANNLRHLVMGVQERPAVPLVPGLTVKGAQGGVDIYVPTFEAKGVLDSYIDSYKNITTPAGPLATDAIRVVVPNAQINPQPFWMA
jgi:hypothetical protein